MTLVLDILAALLAAFGLVCLAWLAFGRMVLPVGADGASACAVVEAAGNGDGLEQTISGLLWLRCTGLWQGRILLVDRGLSPEGLAVARRLTDHQGVELRAIGEERREDGPGDRN